MTLKNLECKSTLTTEDQRQRQVIIFQAGANSTDPNNSSPCYRIVSCWMLSKLLNNTENRPLSRSIRFSVHFHLVQLFSILFSSSLPYANPLSNQNMSPESQSRHCPWHTSTLYWLREKKNVEKARSNRQTNQPLSMSHSSLCNFSVLHRSYGQLYVFQGRIDRRTRHNKSDRLSSTIGEASST